jgi:hypothetical protein
VSIAAWLDLVALSAADRRPLWRVSPKFPRSTSDQTGDYVVRVPNRGSPSAILLRESYREAGKVKNRTLASLSSWPEAKVEALARMLKGQPPPAAGLGTIS